MSRWGEREDESAASPTSLGLGVPPPPGDSTCSGRQGRLSHAAAVTPSGRSGKCRRRALAAWGCRGFPWRFRTGTPSPGGQVLQTAPRGTSPLPPPVSSRGVAQARGDPAGLASAWKGGAVALGRDPPVSLLAPGLVRWEGESLRPRCGRRRIGGVDRLRACPGLACMHACMHNGHPDSDPATTLHFAPHPTLIPLHHLFLSLSPEAATPGDRPGAAWAAGRREL